MFRKTLSVLAAVSQLCLLFALGAQTAIAGGQLVLNPSDVIGGSGSYDTTTGGGIIAYNAGQFNATNILNNQTGIVTETTQGDTPPSGYWLNPSASGGPSTAYITIDLGAAYSLGEVELFNTSNSNYGDRGSGNFTIFGSNSVTDTGGGNYELSGTPTVLTSGTLMAATPAESFDLVNGIPGQAFSTNGSPFRYLEFQVTSVNAVLDFNDIAYGLDEIRVYQSPEPGSIVALIGLLGMGLIGVGLRRRQSSLAKRS